MSSRFSISPPKMNMTPEEKKLAQLESIRRMFSIDENADVAEEIFKYFKDKEDCIAHYQKRVWQMGRLLKELKDVMYSQYSLYEVME